MNSPMHAALPPASAAQVSVLMSGGFSAAYQELLPRFENTTGITVTTAIGMSQGDGPNTIGAQLRRGVRADLVILSKDGLAELSSQGRIVTGSDVDLAEVPLGVAVRGGAPRPNIGTVDAFRAALLHAKSVGIRSGSGIYLTSKLFPRLGISAAMAEKVSDAGAADVASGTVEMVVLPASEILSVQGVDFVGTIPAEIQFRPVFSAALVKEAAEPEASKRLIAFLASDSATLAIERTGMKRPARRQP
jgi:molybdate transport system substrate-binding protein